MPRKAHAKDSRFISYHNILIYLEPCLSFRQRRVFQWVMHHPAGNTEGLYRVFHIYVNSVDLADITTGYNIARGRQPCSGTTTCCKFIETCFASSQLQLQV